MQVADDLNLGGHVGSAELSSRNSERTPGLIHEAVLEEAGKYHDGEPAPAPQPQQECKQYESSHASFEVLAAGSQEPLESLGLFRFPVGKPAPATDELHYIASHLIL